MGLGVNSLAAAVGSTAKNVQFVTAALNLPRKIAIVGTYDSGKTAVVEDVPVRIFSGADAGDKFGFGYMAHRLAQRVFDGSDGVEAWVVPQAEGLGSVVATGNVDFAGSASVLAGSLPLYIAGDSVPVSLASGVTPQQIATLVVAAITANRDLPVTAEVDGVVDTQVNFTSKTAGPWGNEITIRFGLRGESLPSGVVAVVTPMSAGSGNPDIQGALNGLGTGDDANLQFFTELVHGYGLDTTVLDAISDYVGAGNEFIGLYAKTVGRPFRSLNGNTEADTTGLTNLIALTDNRKLDRASGVVAVPGSASHPAEIAALTIGHMARINNDRAGQHYIGIPLYTVDAGERADWWTSDYDNRDLAVKSGISPTRVASGIVLLQNVVSFYRPDSVPVSSNGYRSMRNIAIVQNIIENIRINFVREAWQGISIVADIRKVSDVVDRQKARDTDAVINDLVALAKLFESKAWLYTADFTVDGLREPGAVTIRPGLTGFDGRIPVILSGEGAILDMVTEFDISIAVGLAAT